MKVRYALVCIGIIVVAIGVYTQVQNADAGEKIRVTVFANAGHAAPIIGSEREIFKDKVEAEINLKILDSGPQAIESLFSGSSDMAYVGPGPVINGFTRSDGDIVILGGAASGGASFVVQSDSSIRTIADLDRMRVAAPQIANTQDVSLRYHLEQNGLRVAERGGSVYVINVPNPDIYVLFARGDIDAAWVPEPWATLLVRDLNATRVFEEEELWDNQEFASALLVTRTQYAEQNPHIIEQWLDAHAQSVEWIESNPEESAQILHMFIERELGTSFDLEIISESLLRTNITTDPIKPSIQEFAQRSYDLGYLGRTQYSLDGLYYGEVSE